MVWGSGARSASHRYGGTPPPESRGHRINHRLAFLRAFLRNRRAIGAITPSTVGLGLAMARWAEVDRRATVAELGAGTGPVTEAILRRLGPEGRLWALDIEPRFVRHLKARFSDPRLTVVQRPAADLADLAREVGLSGFDAVISAIPFRLLGREDTRTLIGVIGRALALGGVFVAVQYDPRYLPPFLDAEFGNWERRYYVWNIPPATILRSIKADHGAGHEGDG